MSEERGLSKAELLAIGAYSAPRLRSATPRRIKITDAAGKVVGETNSVELAVKMHARAGVELAVQDDTRKTHVFCVGCGTIMPVKKGGQTKSWCAACLKPMCSLGCGRRATNASTFAWRLDDGPQGVPRTERLSRMRRCD